MLRRSLLAVLASAASLPAAPALAQEEGVTVDPSSPAGTEYALPIDRARRDATGDGGRSSTKTSAVPAFGEGVGPDEPGAPESRTDPAPSPSAPATRTAGTSTRSTDAPARTGSEASKSGGARRAQERARVDHALVEASIGNAGGNGSSVALLLGGIAAAVVGSAAGLLLRHRTP